MKTTPVRGCIDYLPKDMELREQVVARIKSAYRANGFLQVKTPILENLENLTSGDSGDNVKLMFKTIKRGDKLDLTKPNLTEADIVEEGLRYDLTVPLARLYTKNRENLPIPFKSIQIDESFRAERPQEGRNRQFTQCDVDIWGESGVLGETEIILTTMEAYKAVGLPNVVCKISNRKILNAIILNCGFEKTALNDVCVIVDKLDKIGLDGCKKELSEKGFAEKSITALATALEKIKTNGLDAVVNLGASADEVDYVKQVISAVAGFAPEGYTIEFDITIVRGQGYYTGCVFEMYCPVSGYKRAIGGGGRYDEMYYKFAGSNLPAVGYGLGLDSVLIVLDKLGVTNLSSREKLALVYYPENTTSEIIAEKNKYKQKYDVSVFPASKNYKEFLRRIKLNGFTCLAKLGKDTIENI